MTSSIQIMNIDLIFSLKTYGSKLHLFHYLNITTSTALHLLMIISSIIPRYHFHYKLTNSHLPITTSSIFKYNWWKLCRQHKLTFQSCHLYQIIFYAFSLIYKDNEHIFTNKKFIMNSKMFEEINSGIEDVKFWQTFWIILAVLPFGTIFKSEIVDRTPVVTND